MVHGKKVVAAPVEAPPQNNPQTVTPKSSLPPSFSKGDEVAKEPLKQTIAYLERRLLNLEKRKERLDGYQKQIDEGVQLRSNKEMAVAKREEVAGSINFAQEILNVLSLLSTEVDQVNQKAKENETENKIKMDLVRSQFIAKSLAVFNLFLSNEQIQRDFLEGRNNAVMLEQSELDILLNFSRNCLFSTHNAADNVLTRSEKCGQHLNNLFDRSSSTICRSTYANIAVIASKIFECEYFQSLPDFSQTVEVEEDSKNKNEFEPNCVDDEEDSTDVVKTGIEFSSNITDRISPPEPDTQPDIDSTDKTLPEKLQSFTKESAPPLTQQSAYDQLQNIIGNSADPQLQVSFMSFQVEEPQKEPEPTPSEEMKRPAHTIEEVLADVQGQYNFLQDSMLDVDSVENNITNFSGVGMQPSSLNPDPQDSNASPSSQFNSGPQSVEKDTFLSNGPSITSNDVANLHNPNSLYPNAQMYPGKSDVYASESKLISNQDTQLASQPDNLGMGQTTFGGNEPAYNIDVPVRTQYNDSLHSVDAYQNKPTDINIMKPLQENSYTASPFNSLHGTSQSPFEGSLAGNKIPDPIPMPSGSTLSVDPSQVHIPFPNDKMSGYRGFAGNSQTLDGTAVPGNVENESERFALDEKPHQQSLLSAGDAVHISSSGLKLDSNSIESVTNDVKTEDKNDIATTSRINSDKSSAHQMSRGNRHPAAYQNTSSNYNRGNTAARQQGQPVGGFYQNRSNNFRTPHNRNFGNFDSMGHPKHYGNAGGGYQHPQGGIHPYNASYNRQDNNIYGGMQRRGAGGSGRGNRGFPSRVNMRGANNNNNYNRTRTFRPHNSEPVA